MPIGYAPFSTIEQANLQTVNSLAGLGQQIGNAIETHAATQSAKAMLPMLQQQYQQGMQKIASGDPNGLGDVYYPSLVGSQNPLLAPMANHAVNMAQSANLNTQHLLRTQMYLQGRNAALYGKYGSGLMEPPAGMNPSWQGQQKSATVTDLKNAYDLDTKLEQDQSSALRKNDQATYNNIIQQRQNLRNSLGAKVNLPPIDSSTDISSLKNQLKTEQAKKSILGMGGPNKANIESLQNKINILQNAPQISGQLPAAKEGTGPVIPQRAIDYLKKNPNTANDFDAMFGHGAAQQLLNPQASTDSGMSGQVAQQSPEQADESEAVEGSSQDQELVS